MRTIVSIFLLAAFSVPFFWGPSRLSMEKRKIQKHVRNAILPSVDESELIIFKASIQDTNTNFNWKHSKEFEFQGKMYDIVKRKKQGDKIIYLVWQDDEETVINFQIKQLANAIFNSSKDSSNDLLSYQLLVNSLYTEQIPEFNFAGFSTVVSRTFNSGCGAILIGYPYCVFCPPKQLFIV